MSEHIVAHNRKAGFSYHLLEKCEAGIILTGSEVKSLRAGQCNLGDAYASFKGDELFLMNAHISPYPPAAGLNHAPLRTRKLLLKKHEVVRMIGKIREKGLTLIPVSIYFKRGLAKIELALAKGKKLYDKRESIKKKQHERDMQRGMRRRG